MPPMKTKTKKTQPNDKCPCGSGKKYKKCCMHANQQMTGGESGRGTATIPSAVASTSPTAILDEEVMVFNRVLSDGTVLCYDGALEEAFDLLTTTTAAVGATAAAPAPAAAATNTAAAAAATVAATAASDMHSCSHGITSDHFPDGRTYKSVILDYLSCHAVPEEVVEFMQGHLEYFTNPHFAHFIFAVCTSWYLNTNRTTMEMRDLLLRAVDIKYLMEPKLISERRGGPGPDYDKMNRYKRAIRMLSDDRGVIHCLSRETKAYCHCMKDKHSETEGMAKVEYCSGCDKFFPRAGMRKCSGCKVEFYCDKDCYSKDWPNHKHFCQDMQKAWRAEERILQQAALRESTQTEE